MKNNNQKNILLVVIAVLLVVIFVLYKTVESKNRVNNIAQPRGEEVVQHDENTTDIKSQPVPQTKKAQLDIWKDDCSTKGGEFVARVDFGFGPIENIFCGFQKAPDADFNCKTEQQCARCTYAEHTTCYEHGADIPNNCVCASFKNSVSYYSGEVKYLKQ